MRGAGETPEGAAKDAQAHEHHFEGVWGARESAPQSAERGSAEAGLIWLWRYRSRRRIGAATGQERSAPGRAAVRWGCARDRGRGADAR